MFKQIDVLNFEKFKEYALLQFMWKVRNNEIANRFKSLFYPRGRVYDDSRIKYYILDINLDQTKWTVLFQGRKYYNNLKSETQKKKTLPSFKRALKYLYDT